MKVIAFTSGRNVPSAIYRIREYVAYLEKLDIEVDEYFPFVNKNSPPPFVPTGVRFKYIAPYIVFWFLFKLSFRIFPVLKHKRYAVAWLNREFLPGLFTLERFISIPYVFDFDDAIWLAKPNGQKSFKALCKKAAHVVAGNNFLANEALKYTDKVSVIPTSVDTTSIFPTNFCGNIYTVGWVGTSVNFSYLYKIEDELYQFLNDTNAIFLVVSNVKPSFNQLIEGIHWRFRIWEKSEENEFFNEMDVGIMPLENTDWEKGKCSFKMLQYLAAGKPVVVSPVGTNVEIIEKGGCGLLASTGEWNCNLKKLFGSKETRSLMGKRGRELVCKEYSIEVNAVKIRAIFRELTND
ncbi:MAG: glycosyltransferase involved in cell wall biosynthesis [Psychroserpens sp.]